MQRSAALVIALLALLATPSFLQAFSQHSEKGLWIETREHGKLKTTLAVTENIARKVVESKDAKMNFAERGKKELVTKEMVKSILDGKQKSVTAKDPESDLVITMYLKDLEVPGDREGGNNLVLQTYKAGKKTFSITIPDIEVETKGDDDSGDLVTKSFGWKAFLPYLAKTGGALYVKGEKDDSELWFFVE